MSNPLLRPNRSNINRQSKCDGCRIKALKDTYKALSIDTNKLVVTTSVDEMGKRSFRAGTPTFEGEEVVTAEMCQAWLNENERLKQEHDELVAECIKAKDYMVSLSGTVNELSAKIWAMRQYITSGIAVLEVMSVNKPEGFDKALSITPPAALREIQAQALEEAGAFVLQNMTYTQVWNQQTILQALANLAAEKRK